MRYATLKDGSPIPVLGLGTWMIGGDTRPDYSQDREMVQLIATAIEMGYTHIDTAEYYGGGHTEELIGQAIQGMDRASLFITSKVWPEHFKRDQLHRSLDRSLKSLGTDYVDLYLLHWPSDRVPLAETMQAMNEALADGRIRRMGVSNFDVALMQQAQSLAHAPLVTNQVSYSLLNREPAHDGVLAHCRAAGMLLTAYSPLRGGVIHQPAIQEIAQKHDCTPAQVALQWLLRQPGVITIPKSANPSRLQENLDALDLQLSEEDVARLER